MPQGSLTSAEMLNLYNLGAFYNSLEVWGGVLKLRAKNSGYSLSNLIRI
jgi:hypothetical protein